MFRRDKRLYGTCRITSYNVCYTKLLRSVGMLYVGAYRQMMSNWSDISQLTGLPSALFYLAGVVSAVLMGVIALVRIFNPDWLLDQEETE